MPKTIILLRRNFSPTGGAENYLLRMAKALQTRGYHLELICETWETSEENPFTSIHRTGTQSPPAFARAALHWRHHRPDAFFFSFERVYEADLYRAGDGLHSEWLRRRATYYGLRGRFQNWIKIKNRQILALEKAMIQGGGVHHIIANSRMVLESYAAAGYPRGQLSLIYNGVDNDYFSQGDRARGREFLGLSDTDCVALYIGAGRERKGFYFAREAAEGISGLRFIAIESPQPIPMPHIYAAADIFLFPTLYDPCANVTFEAWAAGLPVITTRENGAAELMDDGREGFVLDRADDIRGLKNRLQLLMDPALRAQMGSAAKALASQNKQLDAVEAMLKIIEGLDS
jgi:UDP-glucose:(heptosyl)LPS alpha-1,3-glucosyltransferase